MFNWISVTLNKKHEWKQMIISDSTVPERKSKRTNLRLERNCLDIYQNVIHSWRVCKKGNPKQTNIAKDKRNYFHICQTIIFNWRLTERNSYFQRLEKLSCSCYQERCFPSLYLVSWNAVFYWLNKVLKGTLHSYNKLTLKCWTYSLKSNFFEKHGNNNFNVSRSWIGVSLSFAFKFSMRRNFGFYVVIWLPLRSSLCNRMMSWNPKWRRAGN